ncbi:protein DOUBLE-STRAND BREAK FORMATION [Phoenix dactylifera]|uniref:Protein DOUBLE-STRAND BREAK FORMATION n=1 Tax=Phoenix dactylifera TaxID=42345 RepID=A0A8B7C5G3_PHODC|nr:protein DOUBLE-STRAND BREAK FORMATION [Phoenix dactylifera]
MSEAISESISLFRSQLENRRFGDATLRILESVLVAKDVRSLLATRSALRDLLRSEAMSVVREISQKTADEKLCVVEFFVRAFALVGDVESCLALKYEALVLRETKYLKSHGLQVLHEEWLTFAKDSLDNGFYAIAIKGFESALMCIQSNNNINQVTVTMEEQTVNKIKKLRDMATALVASHSVQTQSAEYLKRKAIQEDPKCSSCSANTSYVASSMFRQGIKRRNMQKLNQSQAL